MLSVAGLAFLTSHTLYVTAGTFVSRALLLGITAFPFWMRYRRHQSPRTKGLTVTSNTALALLRLSLSDLEGGSRSASCAARPIPTAAPRIEPFRGTDLPLLSRHATKSLFETGGRYPDDRQSALSRREFSDCFSFYCLDRRLEPTRRRSEQCDCRTSARTAEIEYDDKTLQEFVQSISRSCLKLNRPDRLNHESLSRARGSRDDDCVLGWTHSENHNGNFD
jgi:hypothetical protein